MGSIKIDGSVIIKYKFEKEYSKDSPYKDSYINKELKNDVNEFTKWLKNFVPQWHSMNFPKMKLEFIQTEPRTRIDFKES